MDHFQYQKAPQVVFEIETIEPGSYLTYPAHLTEEAPALWAFALCMEAVDSKLYPDYSFANI